MSKDTPQPSCPPQNYPPGEAVPPSYAEAVGSQPYHPSFTGQGPSPSPYTYQYPPVNLGGIGPNPIMNQPGSGPPPPMGFIPSGPMPGNCAQIQPQMIIHSQGPLGQTRTIVSVIPVGSTSTHLTCPNCNAVIDTTVSSSPSIWAWVSGAALFLMGCWAGCCFLPCCIDGCMDKEHSCPNCKAHIAMYRRFGGFGGRLM